MTHDEMIAELQGLHDETDYPYSRARRAECWRELMEVAKASIKCLGDEECMCEQHERVRALQAKWDEGARA